MLIVRVNKKAANNIKKGFPWVLKSDISTRNSSLDIADTGELCAINDDKGHKLAVGFYNPLTFIAARVLCTKPNQKIDTDFFKEKFENCLKRRRKYFPEKLTHFRLVHSEADHLPGLIIDLYGNHAVVQVNSAGMDRLISFWLPALLAVIPLEGVYLEASSRHREKEGLDTESRVLMGKLPQVLEIRENGITYFADIFEGQKTGWFYDQRANRKMLSILSGSRTVLDLYTHSGGFGLLCAARGAASVEMVDRSELALELAEKAAKKNRLDNCTFTKADVFDYLEELVSRKKRFAIVNADPPAFIKKQHDLAVGLKGYEKLVKKCVELVQRDGIFAISSCSYFARPDIFQKTIEEALTKTGRPFELMYKANADKDHPIHPMLAETNYLKFLVYKLD